jgi:hypothetical protein
MSGRKRSEIIADVENHVAKFGGDFTEWYVGVTANPKERLFTQHRLRSSGDAWITRRAIDDLQAAEVQEYFKSVRKTQGGSKGGLVDIFVYAYKRKSHTRP